MCPSSLSVQEGYTSTGPLYNSQAVESSFQVLHHVQDEKQASSVRAYLSQQNAAMPHRVANFLRTSSNNIAHIKKPTSHSRSSNSGNSSPYTSDGEDGLYHASGPVVPHAVKMPDLAEVVKKTHRLSLPFGRSSKDSSSASSNSSLAISWSIESPPIVFHGNVEESTGALVSGQMFLDVKEDVLEIDSFAATLKVHVVQKRPFQGHCSECQNQHTEIKAWSFIVQPTTLRRGKHAFPFSVLLDGHLPASLDTPVLSIAYEFKSEACVARSPGSSSSPCAPLKFERPLVVKRSQPVHDMPHHSIRVFPPTNIKVSAHYMTVIHPTGANKVSLRLDGLSSHNNKGKTIDMWKLKKVTWRLEETIKTVAPACEKHTPHVTAENASKKGIARQEVRLLGEKLIHDGWKSNYSTTDGTAEFEFDYCVNQRKGRELKFACDSKSRDGTEVTHSLLVELVVSKEYAPESKPHLSSPTGTGRILRMHYGVVMTDYPGMGVSWDNEAPPVYQDVPPSPPGYPVEVGLTEYDDLEPLYAERASVEPLEWIEDTEEA